MRRAATRRTSSRRSSRSRRNGKKGMTNKRKPRGGNGSSVKRKTVQNTLDTMPIELYAQTLSDLDVQDWIALSETAHFFRRRLPELKEYGFMYHAKRVLTPAELRRFKVWEIPVVLLSTHERKVLYDRMTVEKWRTNGELHREDGPASITTGTLPAFEDEPAATFRWEHYYNHGKVHRTDGPAWISINPDSEESRTYYIDNQRHRTNGPALIISRPGELIKRWYQNDKQVRGNGMPRGTPGSKPSEVVTSNNGRLMTWTNSDGDVIERHSFPNDVSVEVYSDDDEE